MLIFAALITTVLGQHAADCATFTDYECKLASHCTRRKVSPGATGPGAYGPCEWEGCEANTEPGDCFIKTGTTESPGEANMCAWAKKKLKGKLRCIPVADAFAPDSSYCSQYNNRRKKCGKKGCHFKRADKQCVTSAAWNGLACGEYKKKGECNQHSGRCQFHNLHSPKCFDL